MESGTKISRSLTFINIAGTLAILWLAGSFLVQAEKQRRDSNRSLQSVDIQRVLYDAGTSLAHERANFSYFNNAGKGLSRDQYQQLLEMHPLTDSLIDKAISRLEAIVEDQSYVANRLLDDSTIQRHINELKGYKEQLIVYRNYSHSQLKMEQSERDTSLVRVIHDTYNDIAGLLRYLGYGVQYYPNYNTSETSNYLNLLNDLWAAYEDMMRVSSEVAVSLAKQTALPPDRQRALDVLEVTLDEHWRVILQRSNVDGIDAGFKSDLNLAHNYYQDSFNQQKSLIFDSIGQPSVETPTLESWTRTTRALEGLINKMQQLGYRSVERKAEASLSLSMRNLVIDAFTVLFFTGVAFLAFRVNQRIRAQAFHDALTGLPNRLYLESELQGLHSSAKSNESSVAMIYLDLDRFKIINDNYGHSVGDQLLKQVASRLLAVGSPNDFVSRLGGDEFAVLHRNCVSRQSAMDLAAKMVDALNEDFSVAETELSVGVSAGVSIAPGDCRAGPDLMKNADIAMYHSKVNSQAKVGSYSTALGTRYNERVVMEQALKQAITRNQFFLHYQPKVDCRNNSVDGVEALLRWQHPELGLVSPAQFIPVAEEAGLMGSIGRWVIRQAFNDIAQFNSKNSDPLRVAVNITAQQFADQALVLNILETLADSKLASECVELEVTESMLMSDVSVVNAKLKQLQKSGMTVAIDDFGTGYSSLQYLQELALDVLKIDRAFIVSLDNVEPENSVANTIVQLAKTMRLTTVAEGVETREQRDKVLSLGVDYIQGYLYSKPVAFDDLENQINLIRQELEKDPGIGRVA